MAIVPGTRFGGFDVLSRIGAGGMGEVYRARDTRLGRDVALKVLPDIFAADPERLARFEREARVLASFNHVNIAAIHGVEESPDGLHALVLELVDGDTLADRMSRGRVPFREALAMALQMARALEAAHERGIVHRDLKPANVKVTPEGVVKVLDFGLALTGSWVDVHSLPPLSVVTAARSLRGPTAESEMVTRAPAEASAAPMTTFKTSAGVIMGTLSYMSPEQAAGGMTTPASDMYSLGLLLQELFTGQAPYDRSITHEELIGKVATADTLPITGIDSHLQALIQRLKSTSPAQRPTAVDTFARLTWIAEKPRRRRLQVFVAAVVTAAIIGGLKYTTDVTRERDRAAREALVSGQVTDFLMNLFRVPDPSESRGRAVTARELLNAGARSLEHDLRDQPEVQSRLMETIGQSLDGLGLYGDAQPILEKAVEVRRRVLGTDHPETLRAMTALGSVYARRQQYDQAVKIYKEVVPIQERVFGPEHPDRLAAMQDLGWLVAREGRHTEGEQLVRTALDAERRLLGSEHPNTLLGISRLASVMSWEGRAEDQHTLLREELEIRRRVSGVDHPRTLAAMRQLAGVEADLGRLAEAERLQREVVQLATNVLGRDHPDTASAMNSLGLTLERERRWAEAESMLRSAIDVYSHALGPESDSVLLTRNNLGLLYLDAHRSTDAQAVLEPLLEVSKRTRGVGHQRTLNIMNNLALVYANVGRYRQATQLISEVVMMARKGLGETHPLTAAYVLSSSEIAAHAGDAQKALHLLRDAIDRGYRDANQLSTDEYFAGLRSNPQFQALVDDVRNRALK